MRFTSSILGLLLTSVAFSQTPQTLSDYLIAHPWNPVQSGPMLVIDPHHVPSSNGSNSLSNFQRMVLKAGDLSVIAPTQMVVFNDSLKQPPNPADGLGIGSKMIYLMTGLSADQWNALLGDGLGLGDLNPDQQKVFLSLLPNPFSWNSYTVGQEGQANQEKDRATLDEKDRTQVRLYIRRHLTAAMPISGRPNSYGFVNPDSEEPGDVGYVRRQDQGTGDLYGTPVRASVKNGVKASDLDYGRLSGRVTLAGETTVKEAIAQVANVTHVELYADSRVAALPIVFSGTDVGTGDLLKGIALAIGGTYRKVGPAYVLTADLVGIGSRKAKFTTWENDLRQALRSREGQWQLAIGAKGKIFNAKFDANDPMSPPESIFPLQDDFALSPQHFIPMASLPSKMQRVLQRAIQNSRAHFDSSQVGLMSDYQFGFALPNGQKLKPEGSMGRSPQYKGVPGINVPGPQLQNIKPPEGANCRIAIEPKNISDAKSFVDIAAKEGMAEIWIETSESSVLSAAVEEGRAKKLSVRLLAHPWSLPGVKSVSDPDRNIVGDSGSALGEARQARLQDREASSLGWIGAWEQPLFSPTDSRRDTRWTSIIQLAQIPGLAGVVLLNPTPAGYRKTGGPQPADLSAQLDMFGYSLSQRLSFLRAEGVDPIDLPLLRVPTRIDFSPPFFTEADFQTSPSGDPRPAWNLFLSDANHKAIVTLATALAEKNVNVLMEGQSGSPHQSEMRQVKRWQAGQELPVDDGRIVFNNPDDPSISYFDFSQPGRQARTLFPGAIWVLGFGPASPGDVREALDQILAAKS